MPEPGTSTHGAKEDLSQLDALKAQGFEVALYTWRQKHQMPDEILRNIDWLKTGEYREELKTSTSAYVGSSNQRFLKVA